MPRRHEEYKPAVTASVDELFLDFQAALAGSIQVDRITAYSGHSLS